MMTQYISGNCKINVEKKKADDMVMKEYIESLPFKIIIYDKFNIALRNISTFDNIDNILDYKRQYGKKTYITFPIKIEGDTSIRIDDDVTVEESKDGVIAVSKRYIRTFFPELKTALAKEVKLKGRQLCDSFIVSSLESIIYGEYYNVTLYQDHDEQKMEMVFVNDVLSLRQYIANNIKFSNPSFKELLTEIN